MFSRIHATPEPGTTLGRLGKGTGTSEAAGTVCVSCYKRWLVIGSAHPARSEASLKANAAKPLSCAPVHSGGFAPASVLLTTNTFSTLWLLSLWLYCDIIFTHFFISFYLLCIQVI